jgi:hypothetical protein
VVPQVTAPSQFDTEEIKEVIDKYPGLAVTSSGEVAGRLDFDAIFEQRRIEDSFLISVRPPVSLASRIPSVFETGGRLDAIAKARGIRDLRDLHLSPGGAICLCVKQEELERAPPGSSLLHFIDALVIPYFFAVSHFDSTGERWIWGEYSHGVAGMLEYYADTRRVVTPEDADLLTQTLLQDRQAGIDWAKQVRSPSAKRLCPCGSGKRTGECHRRALKGAQFVAIEFGRLKSKR